jgi:rhodanese-related sulfurtransferase
MAHIQWGELPDLDKDDTILIDLRNKKELETSGVIEGARHIPLDELRSHLSELDREKNYIPFCAAGLRAYLGHRILVQNGLQSRNLSGGYITYLGGKEKIMMSSEKREQSE